MAKKSLEQVIAENLQLGFDPEIIKFAYQRAHGDSDKVLQEIFKLQEQSNQFPTKPSNPQDEDAQLSKAIEMSINQAKDKKITLEPLNPEQRIRKTGIPVGLKNIGNTCYFNSLLQTYFQNVNFVRTILSYQIPNKYKQQSDSAQQKINQQDGDFKRKQASCKLVENLKVLFGNLIASDRKYIDPTDVISSIVDDYGNEMTVGDQKDIGQFNLVFLSRIDEGLQLGKKQFEMDIENKEEKKEDTPSKIKVFGEEKSDQISLIHRSSIKIEDNSLIDQQFIGKMSNFFENEKQNIHKSEEELFSLLFVNVRNGQLYKALEDITIQHIDDYRNEKGQVVGVEKQSWIKEAPKTLFFQIDRVVFNKEKSTLQKINDQFDFPQVFYIDPFLNANKVKALEIQKRVRKLRQQKAQYKEALKQLEKYGDKGLNLLDLLQHTTKFLSDQNSFMDTQKQIDNPLSFPALSSSIKPENLQLLVNYRDSIKKRMEQYKNKVEEIDKQIENNYASIRSTPYFLYSILIHEGSADTGHYYSYTYDLNNKIWRKYNDINISEQVEQQVMKEARGINYTSAYYLVYAQKQVLVPKNADKQLRNFALSSEDKYLNDYYSSLIPAESMGKIKQENAHMYLEIQQYKMGSFANRVIDNYTKNFQACNQVHRKTKVDKKKNNTPPLLTNLPIFLKDTVNEQTYRNCLIENAIQGYGPKDYNPVFEDLIKKKVANFNDFKKPKQFKVDQKFVKRFMQNVMRANAAKKLFEILNNQNYDGLFGLMFELRGGEKGDYFDWVSNLICKILIVRLLLEAQSEKQDFRRVINRLQLLIGIMFGFISIDDEKPLYNNTITWMMEINLELPEQPKKEVEGLITILSEKKYAGQFDYLLKSEKDPLQEYRNSMDEGDVRWNLSRTENTLINAINDARQSVKMKMKIANQLYQEMKKQNLPLRKEDRNLIKQKNK